MRRLAFLCLAVFLAFAPRADAGKPVWPKSFEVQYCWGYPGWDAGCPSEILSFNSNHTWTAPGGDGTWSTGRGGATITLLVTGNTTRYDGVRQSDGSYDGTMTTGVPGGPTGFWKGWYR